MLFDGIVLKSVIYECKAVVEGWMYCNVLFLFFVINGGLEACVVFDVKSNGVVGGGVGKALHMLTMLL